MLSTRSSLPADFRRTSLFTGIGAGRRFVVGDVAVLGGIVAGVSFDSERFSTSSSSGDQQGTQGGDGQQTGDPTSTVSHSTSRIEPRTGLYFGVAFPRRSRIRFRPTLTADCVPSRLGKEVSLDPSVPSLPWWSLGLSLGMEGAIP